MTESGEASHQAGGDRATAWLSHGFETLLERLAREPARLDGFDFDVVIVGSGYGGAVALSRLAGYGENGEPLRLCMLERGSEYLPGAFPASFAELPGHLRFSGGDAGGARGVQEGLFDLRLGDHVGALVANGLGGGSLINAGVMAEPSADVFAEARWPSAIRADAARMLEGAAALKRELGATRAPSGLGKVAAMRRLANGQSIEMLDITVADVDGETEQGVAMRGCIGCGDCMSGCNHSAKASLDATLLAGACRRGRPEIVTGATVLQLRKTEGDGWTLDVVYSNSVLRRRQGVPLELRARRVILAAGAFGSTEILLRSAGAGLGLSPRLGRQFSANGDAVAAVYGRDDGDPVSAVADETIAPAERNIGPTICAMIDRRSAGDDMVLQELAVPATLRGLFEQTVLTADALARLGELDNRVHRSTDGGEPRDPAAVDPARIERSLLLAIIGRDDASGELQFVRDKADGSVRVHWPTLSHDRRFAERESRLRRMVAVQGNSGERVLANPLWRPVPDALEGVLGAPRGPSVTVHPLGGCPMGEDGASGVVDDVGRVFVGASSLRHDDLLVLDGSIVPTSLGINPALTITILAARAIEIVRDQIWQLHRVTPRADPSPLPNRPIFRDPPPTVKNPRPTLIEVTERLRGEMLLDLGDGPRRCDVVLTLWSAPLDIRSLMAPTGPRSIPFDAEHSELEIFPAGQSNKPAARLRDGKVSGELRLFAHRPSTPLQRRWRGLGAWLGNRGLRDLVQGLRERIGGAPPAAIGSSARWRLMLAMASHAGDRRLLEYELQVMFRDGTPRLAPAIRGFKEIGYTPAGNPWNQLQQVKLSAFPGWNGAGNVILHLAPDYFPATDSPQPRGVPLMHVVGQQNLPTALADLAAFGGYVGRVLLDLHVLSLRAPDRAPAGTRQRLPVPIDGLPEPQTIEFAVDVPLADGTPVLARLTRYRPCGTDSALPPVVLIHGYSASGTTFVHPALPEAGLAAHLCRLGRDVWVLDLRSSCGMPTAEQFWTFEQIGYTDIPLAVARVLDATGRDQVDLVAHCMGAAMLCMGLLGPHDTPPGEADPQQTLRRLLPQRIRRLVLSQVGPALRMAPANTFRGYLMRYLQNYVPLGAYRFRSDAPTALDDLLDRVLATVPYPAHEFRRENPLWPPGARTPWVALRHRMDLLYGMTFKLECMSPRVLDRLDDFFGPMNAQTAAQVIHFARYQKITDVDGRNRFVRKQRIAERLSACRIMSLHSSDNGLVDFETARLTARTFGRAGVEHRPVVLRGFGHQDSLIGERAPEVFRRVADFLQTEISG